MMSANVVPLRAPVPEKVPTSDDLIDRIRTLSTDTLNIRMDHPHIQQRLAMRGLTMLHMLETLRKGKAPRAPSLDIYGDWRLKIERLVAGRKVQIVVVVKADHIVIVTAI